MGLMGVKNFEVFEGFEIDESSVPKTQFNCSRNYTYLNVRDNLLDVVSASKKQRLSQDRPIRRWGRINRLGMEGHRSPVPQVEPLPKKRKTTAIERKSRSV